MAVGALLAGLLLPAQAMAAYEAWTQADLNLRVGPDTSYGIIDVIPYGEPVAVFGCLDGIEWCDVEWYGLRGWVSAYYLAQPGTSLYLPQIYTRIGLPIIVFSFNSYHDRHYHDRPWYKKRYGRWHGKDWRKHRDHDWDRDRKYSDRDRERDRDGADRPKKGERVQRPAKDLKVEKPRQRQEVQKSPKRQEVKRSPKRQEVKRLPKRQEVKRSPKRQEVKRSPKRQEVQKTQRRQETKRPQRQRVEQKQVQSTKQRQASGLSSGGYRQVERSQRKIEVQRRRGQ